jgi:hypothetical protein
VRRKRRNRDWWVPTTEEIYVYRTRKPWSPLGLPLVSRHFGYGGRTTDPKARHHEHTVGGKGGRFGNRPAQPWADLEPKRHVVFPLKTRTKGMTSFLEKVVIRGLLCVYNDQFNHGNPRRISLSRARWQRVLRDKYGRAAMWGELMGRYLVLSGVLAVLYYLWSLIS